MLIKNAEVDKKTLDIRIRNGSIDGLAPHLGPMDGEEVLDAGGGAALPGLNDHHIHLNAAARSLTSLQCGPPSVKTENDFKEALNSSPGDGWIRGVGYHQSVAGALNKSWLDRFGPKRPIRIQHRSGRLWVFNSLGLAALGPDAPEDGRLLDADATLRDGL
ncbi:MAG: amidohydrolase family protein, partial [Pseudomonadota bacterium]